MAIWIEEDAKVLVQGITGKQGHFHADKMVEYGTNIVGGCTPGKGGQTVELQGKDYPVWDSMREAIAATDADATVIYVPPPFAGEAIMEAAEAFDAVKGEGVVVCITEGIPTLDMVKAVSYVYNRPGVRLIGPNCPGIITPGENGGAKIGIMPGHIHAKGRIGIVSKSGTLTYEAADQVVKQGLGITTAIGIGGDPIIGTTTKEALEMLINDSETECVVMIGEIGGQLEGDAAKWYKNSGSKKPVVGFIAGETAPAGRTMGHAGAIVGGSDDTAQAKKQIMRECGIHVVESPAEIGKKVAQVLA